MPNFIIIDFVDLIVKGSRIVCLGVSADRMVEVIILNAVWLSL